MLRIIKRTINEAFKNFLRNGWLTFATSSILTLSIYTLSILLIITLASNVLIKNIQDKANVSVYFKQDVPEETIANIKKEIEKNNLISSVLYISKEQALEDFKNNNASEEIILKSIEQIGENPLLSSLVIKTHNPGQYQAVYEYLNAANFSPEISRINYVKNKEIIDKLNVLIGKIKKIGLGIVLLLALISILITFNSIRITIYNRHEEVEIMRLVGASNSFIRLPYVFEGMLYSLSAAAVSIILVFVTTRLVSPTISSSLIGMSFINFFWKNFWLILGLQIFAGSILGIVSSMIAIRKYLKV
jgi:cell division transport system permease protein